MRCHVFGGSNGVSGRLVISVELFSVPPCLSTHSVIPALFACWVSECAKRLYSHGFALYLPIPMPFRGSDVVVIMGWDALFL